MAEKMVTGPALKMEAKSKREREKEAAVPDACKGWF